MPLKANLVLLICLILFSSRLEAQDFTSQALEVLRSSKVASAMSAGEIDDVKVSSQHTSNNSGLHYLYLHQQHQGIEIDNAISTMAFRPDGTCVQHVSRFVPEISTNVVKVTNLKSAEDALKIGLADLGYESISLTRLKSRNDSEESLFACPQISRADLPAKKLWFKSGDRYVLTYETYLHEKSGDHIWRILIEASSGKVVFREDRLLKCSFHPESYYNQHNTINSSGETCITSNLNTNSYNVLPLHIESPLHGERRIISDPADPVASPFGWHDTDGVPGAEFEDTRGNNVFTQEDLDGDDLAGLRPSGGQDLRFDFPLSPQGTPEANLEASLTNLFFWSNINHDIFYHYGFDESAGNYQINNYGADGLGDDPVFTDSQDANDRNNARFFTLGDGSPARMEMFLWGADLFDSKVGFESELVSLGQEILAIESDFSFQNKLANSGEIKGELVLVQDRNGNLACADSLIINSDQLAGSIAVINRGTCFFVEKVRNAAKFGAIAVIVCNNEPGDPVIMSGDGDDITIPAIMIRRSDCQLLLAELSKQPIVATIARNISEDDLDSSLDNLIITHEYSHGLSIRLTGGSRVAVCLNNEEQMGEGWSDYFGLMLTTNWEQARGAQRRGIATYLVNQSTSGGGIRNYPYSTDMNINPVTYSDIREFSVPHGVGSVWCSMLWDMTWGIIETAGISTDIYNGNGGNNIALSLVIEALKLQPCNPGFVDGRDAILLADSLLYDGANQYAIWKAFAQRGLGVNANQNNANSRSDGISSFDLPAEFSTQVTSFTATDSLRSIVLNWTSAQEYGNVAYHLERSENGVNFMPIANVPGQLLKTTQTPYRYEDKNVEPGILYHYQLSRTDDRGITVHVDQDSAIIVDVENLIVFPNPSFEITSIKVANAFTGPFTLSVFDAVGKLVLQRKITERELHQSYPINTSQMQPGVYFVEVSSIHEKLRQKLLVY